MKFITNDDFSAIHFTEQSEESEQSMVVEKNLGEFHIHAIELENGENTHERVAFKLDTQCDLSDQQSQGTLY